MALGSGNYISSFGLNPLPDLLKFIFDTRINLKILSNAFQFL